MFKIPINQIRTPLAFSAAIYIRIYGLGCVMMQRVIGPIFLVHPSASLLGITIPGSKVLKIACTAELLLRKLARIAMKKIWRRRKFWLKFRFKGVPMQKARRR
jgi:hypothetical protein